jgi:uncharacterized membrane protein (DUF2068 family)
MGSQETAPVPAHDVGLRVIITYKATKAVIWLLLAAGLGIGLHFGLTDVLRQLIIRIDSRLTHAWASHAAETILQAVTRRHIFYTLLGLSLDGILTAVEAWALHHRKMWGEWLVVLTTGSLLPFEAWALARHLRWERLGILVINVAIVIYLIRRIREQRASRYGPVHGIAAAGGE